MKKKYILALDQGTTSSRAILFDDAFEYLGMEQEELRQFYPRNGWVEQDPIEIWGTQIATAKRLLKNMRIEARDITGIGLTNQRETIIAWNRETGEPCSNAIVWQDKRTSDECESLRRQGLQDTIREKTGLIPDSYFSATKISWLLRNTPGLAYDAGKGKIVFGNVDAWLVFNLTGGKVVATDYSNASRTMLLNLETLWWDSDLLKLFNIPESCLPSLHSTSGYFGDTDPAIFGVPIPILSAVGDQQAALFGQACFLPGEAKNTYGTGCFVLMNTGNRRIISSHGLLTTLAWEYGGKKVYAMEGSVFITGAVIKWLTDAMGFITSPEQAEEIAASLTDNDGVYVVPAFSGLGSPYWDQYAKGGIFGLSHRSNFRHIVRAGLESIAYQTRDVVDRMKEETGLGLKSLKVDGGGSVNKFLMQFQADILRTEITVPGLRESTACGAAYLAGIAANLCDEESIRNIFKAGERYIPKMDSGISEQYYGGWKEAVRRTLSKQTT
jgi:glycerol kinase